MKQRFVILSLALVIFQSCATDPTKPAAVTPANQAQLDSLDQSAITTTIHGFYKWYAANVDLTNGFDFLGEQGKHYQLIEPKLEAFLTKCSGSGFLSPKWIENTRAYYHNCAIGWVSDEAGDIPTGMDYSREYCGQDYVEKEYETVPVQSSITGQKAESVLTFASGSEVHLFLDKENGKWLITAFCDANLYLPMPTTLIVTVDSTATITFEDQEIAINNLKKVLTTRRAAYKKAGAALPALKMETKGQVLMGTRGAIQDVLNELQAQ